jgi:hypothetical protein
MKTLFAAAALAAVAGSAQAALVAYWNVNANPIAASGTQAATTINAAFAANGGTATLTNNQIVAANYLWFTPVGASAHGGLNGLIAYGDVNGNDLGIQNGSGGVNNGKFITFRFDNTGFTNLVMTFAGRRTSTGFTSIDVSTSNDGTNFTAAGSVTTTTLLSTGYSLQTVNLAGATNINNAANAYVRLTFQGTGTSAAGNVRLDNFQFNGDVIPTPGAAALLGLAGLAATRRRR